MSSPKSVVVGGQAREGTRIVLREITAMLHNSPTQVSPRRKSGNDNSTFSKAAAAAAGEHEVKVRFAREFADADSVTYSPPESLSSASSFYSVSSALSTKSSSGVSSDTLLGTPQLFDVTNTSYVDSNIPGVDDLIRACADIRIDAVNEESPSFISESGDNTQDQTFESAIDDTALNISGVTLSNSPVKCDLNDTRPIINAVLPLDVTHSLPNCHSQTSQEDSQEHVTCTDLSQELSSNFEVCLPTIEASVGDRHSPDKSEQDLRESEIESVKLSLELSPAKPSTSVDICEAEAVTVEEVSNSADENKIVKDNVDGNEANLDNVNKNNTDTNSCESKPITEVLNESKDICNIDEKKTNIDNLDEDNKYADDINENKTGIDNVDTNKADTDNICENKTDTDNICKKQTGTDNICENQTGTDSIDESKASTNDVDENKTGTDNVNENKISTDNIGESKADTDNTIREESDRGNIDNKEIRADSFEKEESIASQELPPLNIPTNENNDCNKEEEVIAKSEIANEQENIQLECKNNIPEPLFIENEKPQEKADVVNDLEIQTSPEELDKTLSLSDGICMTLDSLNEIEQYDEFKPQRQSTTLANVDAICALKDLELAAGEIADDILKSSLEFEDEVFSTPVLEIFQDPTTFDFLSARGNSQSTTRLRNESLYIKFDPLLANVSMLPQGNSQVFSTPPSGTIHKLDEIQDKNDEPIQVSKSDTKEVEDTDATEKLELVRATVLQLEKELEKQKKDHEGELEKQKTAFQEKITKLQAQLSQEIENKNQLTVVVDEYEKSISRLLTEKERDRANLEQEKTKLQEELQATNHHLSNTEAAFNDVHLKYERLKGVVSAYKNNEGVLKESIQENLETIKSLENRYDQLKTHAMSQLRKANLELVDIRKQHEAETVKLHAMVRKAELKSNSLAEIVEQKTKENKELTQILDELIARVGRQNAE